MSTEELKIPKICQRCGAMWLWEADRNVYQHYWTRKDQDGKYIKGNEDDLAGLVCNPVKDQKCINPSKGSTLGDTWGKRSEDLPDFGENML